MNDADSDEWMTMTFTVRPIKCEWLIDDEGEEEENGPHVAFETVPILVSLAMVLPRPNTRYIGVADHCLFLRLSPPGNWWCDVLGFVNAGCTSSSTLQIFQNACHWWWLLCPPLNLLNHFPWLQHVLDSRSTGVFENGCRALSRASLDFPFHFLQQSSSSLWEWLFVWSSYQWTH